MHYTIIPLHQWVRSARWMKRALLLSLFSKEEEIYRRYAFFRKIPRDTRPYPILGKFLQ